MSESPVSGAPSLHHPITPDSARLEAGAATFRMLADPTRLHILWLLAEHPAGVGSLVERTGATRTSVSQHLAKLRFTQLVSAKREGRNVVYSIIDGHLARLVREGMNHADHRVTGEPTHE
ncbi:DNA-binding transcriptional ArsR family regulator [Arthrobacter pigmenti]|uniref:DNA-binding transcriptional ArsR family regulator n=1 Tax=Arthrobacter pigmenti TaxID=271432 RepID=A0A846RYT4_9MICC|nr:metalloregulator ArsR/SmtB family transcription factor [Arthrobacter pigmenti]NJC23361.1 DNA-binding transcriptional ArsR family regulator [Arthrobacter pigmenti]